MGTLSHQGRWVPVGAPQAVPQSEVLSVVVVEEEVMVGVVCGAVNDAGQAAGDAVVSVVDRDGPDVDKDVEGQVEHLVEGEEERVDVVRETLHEAVHWMESVAGERGGDLPQVVWFVEKLVYKLMMQKPMDPVDTHVGEKQEGDHAQEQAGPT